MNGGELKTQGSSQRFYNSPVEPLASRTNKHLQLRSTGIPKMSIQSNVKKTKIKKHHESESAEQKKQNTQDGQIFQLPTICAIAAQKKGAIFTYISPSPTLQRLSWHHPQHKTLLICPSEYWLLCPTEISLTMELASCTQPESVVPSS